MLAIVRPGRVSDGVDHPADRHHGGQSHLEQHPGGPAAVREELLQLFKISSIHIIIMLLLPYYYQYYPGPFIAI